MRGNKSANVENLYNILMVSQNASFEEIEKSFQSNARIYDPDITGDNSNLQIFEELKLAYTTLINPEQRKGYDLYLASVGVNMSKDK